MNNVSSLYIHIPFCLSRCRYCDFASRAAVSPSLRSEYLSALCREIDSLPTGELETLYFGGGTPSLLTERELSLILDAVSRRFSFKPHAEITLECNPATATVDKLSAFRSLGITRLSIGMQSLSDTELTLLGRVHTADDFRETYRAARRACFESVSCDLMYGLPSQTLSSLKKTLTEMLLLAPDHVSAYGLMLEEGTPLYAERETLVFPNEDEEYAMYEMIVRAALAYGYSHYEISNYAKPRHACRHNLVYWKRMPYHAVGLSASSFDGVARRTHTRELSRYLADPVGSFDEITAIAPSDAAFEEIMLSLRLGEGLSLSDFRAHHGFDVTERYRDVLTPWRRRGYLKERDGRLFLSDEGLYLSSALLCEILSATP